MPIRTREYIQVGQTRIEADDETVRTLAVADLDVVASLSGLTSSVDELNILDGVTATAAELNAVADASGRIVNIAATETAVALTAAAHAERLVILPIITSAGLTITLPAATGTGNKYTVINNGVQTLSTTITALAGDLLYGIAKGYCGR
jgi:hypothetical protein